MRVNVYAEEMTDRVEIISKEIEGQQFTGVRFYLELPATVGGKQYRGPFLHRADDDDSGAVTFWGKRALRGALQTAVDLLDAHQDGRSSLTASERPPAIGAARHDGIYAGLSLAENEPVHLVLLPGKFKGAWKESVEWASTQGGTLPSRIDQLVLFQNVRSEFDAEWYWSSELCDAESAWFQTFNYGYQFNDPKGGELRARAVRRVPL